MKKIIFMGTPQYASVIFQRLLEQEYEILALFTQADKKVGRKQIVTPPHIKQFSLDHGLSMPIYQPDNLKDEATFETIKNLKPDFIIVAAYGQLLPQSILDLAPCINLHASLLPKYRGASPIQECLINNDEFTGVTCMEMELGLDSGDILGLKYIKVEDEFDVEYLFDKLAYIAADLIIDVLGNYSEIKSKKQDESQVSFCGKISKEDGLIDFSSALKLSCTYKAYKFWPGIFLESQMKLKELSLHESKSENIKGKILEILDDYIIVGCETGSIKLTKVQLPSKKEVKTSDYIRGARLKVGNIIL